MIDTTRRDTYYDLTYPGIDEIGIYDPKTLTVPAVGFFTGKRMYTKIVEEFKDYAVWNLPNTSGLQFYRDVPTEKVETFLDKWRKR